MPLNLFDVIVNEIAREGKRVIGRELKRPFNRRFDVYKNRLHTVLEDLRDKAFSEGLGLREPDDIQEMLHGAIRNAGIPVYLRPALEVNIDAIDTSDMPEEGKARDKWAMSVITEFWIAVKDKRF